MTPTDTPHVHDESCKATGAICGGTGRVYLAYVRRFGARTYKLVGKPTKSRRVAMNRMMEAMLEGDFKRGMVAFADDYYDPEPLYEMVRS